MIAPNRPRLPRCAPRPPTELLVVPGNQKPNSMGPSSGCQAPSAPNCNRASVITGLAEPGLLHGRVAARRRIQHGHGGAVVEGEREQRRREDILAHEEAPGRVVQRAAGRTLAIVGGIAVQRAGSQTVHVGPAYGRIDGEHDRRVEAALRVPRHFHLPAAPKPPLRSGSSGPARERRHSRRKRFRRWASIPAADFSTVLYPAASWRMSSSVRKTSSLAGFGCTMRGAAAPAISMPHSPPPVRANETVAPVCKRPRSTRAACCAHSRRHPQRRHDKQVPTSDCLHRNLRGSQFPLASR